jgi:DnaJ family protein C protein 2
MNEYFAKMNKNNVKVNNIEKPKPKATPIKKKKIFALPMGDDEEAIQINQYTLSEAYTRTVEPAGERFEEIITLILKPQEHGLLDEEDDEDDIIEEDFHEYEWEKEYRSSKKFSNGFKMKSKKKEKIDNHYSLMGIEEQFINVTADELRRAYKKVCLAHHPDKKECENEEEKKEANVTWLKYKEAYETLNDPDKKAIYDSTLDFDDDIPTIKEVSKIKEDKDFYRVFGPVFLKNSIWSSKKPVPKVGDMDTEFKKVKKFYNFWISFNTWRVFTVEGEHNLEEAENRWEKRAMQKENQKLKSKKNDEEKKRIRDLVDLAYKNDPRVIIEEKKIAEEKERLKKERAELVERKRIEREEEEKRLQLENEEKLRKKAEELIILKKTLYDDLLKLIKEELQIDLSNDDIFSIQLNQNIENFKTIMNEVDELNSKDEKVTKFQYLASKMLGLKFVNKDKDSTIWTREQVNNLQKGTKKYPAGVGNRWDKIYEIVKSKSVNQIIKMTRYLATNPNGVKFDGEKVDLEKLLSGNTKEVGKKSAILEKKPEVSLEDNWSEEQQKEFEAALKSVSKSLPANERWTKIATKVNGKNKKDCVERYKFISSKLSKKNNK